MKEKVFKIPKNVYSGTEIIENLYVKDLLAFIPSGLLVYVVMEIPFNIKYGEFYKFFICLFLLVIPFLAVWIRPYRKELPAWTILRDHYLYSKRQRVYEFERSVTNVRVITKTNGR